MTDMNEKTLLATVKTLRDLGFGRPTAYQIARTYGFKAGKRFLIPLRVVEALLNGTLPGFEAAHPLTHEPGCPACGGREDPINLTREEGEVRVCLRCGWETEEVV